MENQAKKTGRRFKYLNKKNAELSYKKYFKEGKIYEEGSDELTDFLVTLMPKRMVLNGDFLNILTDDGMSLSVLSEDFELVKEDENITLNNEATLNIKDLGKTYNIELKGHIDLRVLKKALKKTLKDVNKRLKQIDPQN